jgi:Ice-binding-like
VVVGRLHLDVLPESSGVDLPSDPLPSDPHECIRPNMKRNLIAPVAVVAAIAVLMMSSAAGLALGSASSSGSHAALINCTQKGVPLGSAANFRVLAGTTVTNKLFTVVKGNLGVSPGSAVTGFPPGKVTGTIHKTDKAAAKAQRDLLTAYNNAMGRTKCPTSVAGNIGGMTLGPGLYRSTSSLMISSGDLTLTAHGHSGAVFIFQIESKFVMTSGRHVILAGGAQAIHIYWAVGSSATLGTTSVLYGDLLVHKSISMATGATLHGRALAHIGAVTMQGNSIAHILYAPSTVTNLVAPPNFVKSGP